MPTITKKNMDEETKMDKICEKPVAIESVEERKEKVVPKVDREIFDSFLDEYRTSTKNQKNYNNILQNLNNLYSEEFLKQLTLTLGRASTFNKGKIEVKQKIQEKVDALFLLETHYKYYHKKTKHQEKPLLSILEKEFKAFSNLYYKAKEQSSTKKNVNKKFFYNKISSYLKHILPNHYLLSGLFNDKEKKILESLDFNGIINSIPAKEIFLFLCACSIRIAYKNIVLSDSELYPNENHEPYDSFLKIESSELKNLFKFRMLFLLISVILEKMTDRYEAEKKEIIGTYVSDLADLEEQRKLNQKAEGDKVSPTPLSKKINEIKKK